MGILGTVPPRNDNYCIQTMLFFQKNMLTTFENINRLKSVNSIIIANNKQFHTRKIPQKKQQLQNLLDIRYLENLNDTTNPFNSVTYLLGFHVS